MSTKARFYLIFTLDIFQLYPGYIVPPYVYVPAAPTPMQAGSVKAP